MGLLLLTLKEKISSSSFKIQKNQENNLLKQNFLPFFWSLKNNKKEKQILNSLVLFLKLKEENKNLLLKF
jgi:hypothetical protein